MRTTQGICQTWGGKSAAGQSLAKASRKRARARVASAVFGNRNVLPAGCQMAPSSDKPPPVTAVNVRVEDEPLRPGMQNGEDADGAADPARIAGQHDDRRGGGLDQRAVAVDLMPAQRGPQLLGHGDGDVEIGNR